MWYYNYCRRPFFRDYFTNLVGVNLVLGVVVHTTSSSSSSIIIISYYYYYRHDDIHRGPRRLERQTTTRAIDSFHSRFASICGENN